MTARIRIFLSAVEISLLIFIIYLVSSAYSKISSDDFSSNATVAHKKNIEILFLQLNYYKRISRAEQTDLIKLKFENEKNITFETPRDLANSVVQYLLDHEKEEEKITELSRSLLKPLGEYGSKPEEEILKTQKMAVIHDWLQHVIFNKSFDDWFLKEIQSLKKSSKDDSLVFYGNLKRHFFNYLNGNTSLGILSSKARIYYLKHLLNEYMPSFFLQVNTNENRRLQYMHLSALEFSYLHVGMKLLSDSGEVKIVDKNLDEIIDYGIFFESIFRTLNPEYCRYFNLPAKIYCVSTLNYTVPRTHWSSCYEKYFNFLQQYTFRENQNSKGKWKTRPELAKEELSKQNVSEDYLNQYLLYGGSNLSFKNKLGTQVRLNSIDKIFEIQNRNISDSFETLDKLLLSNLFYLIDQNDKKFLQQSEVDVVRIEFFNPKSRGFVCISTVCGPTEDGGGKLKTQVPEYEINMLRCRKQYEKRIYALKADQGNYKLHRVDENKTAILELFKHPPQIRTNDDFTIKITKLLRLKEEKDVDLEKVADKLSKIHSNQIFEALNKQGYEPTILQKILNFLPRLVPFYSCIHDWKYEDPGLATLSCTVDVLTFLPFLGQGIKVAQTFGIASNQAIINSVRIGARQITIAAALRQIGKEMIFTGIPSIQKAIPSYTFLNLGYDLLRTVDPGFGLLRLGGKAAINLMIHASVQAKKIIPSLKVFAESLKNKIIPKLPNIDPSKTVKAFTPEFQEITVVKVGREWGKDIYVRIDLETNVLYGRRFILDTKTNILDLAPFSMRDKVYKLRTIGLGGDGATNAAKKWSKEESSETIKHLPNRDKKATFKLWQENSYTIQPVQRLPNGDMPSIEWSENTYVPLRSFAQTNLLYRLDLRFPNEVLTAGGLLPRPGREFNLDMINHHDYVYLDLTETNEIASAFVSTSPKLEEVIAHMTNFESEIQKKIKRRMCNVFSIFAKWCNPVVAYIYKIRPGDNFYNMRASYLAAGDVSPPESNRRIYTHAYANWWDAGMDEYLALHGIPTERIIEWAPIRAHYSDYSKDLSWKPNLLYNNALDADVSSENVYTYVSIEDREDAMNMGVNIVQTMTGKNKIEARELINSKNIDVERIVKSYNSFSEEELKTMILG